MGSIDAFVSGGGLIDMVSNQVERVFMVGFLLQVEMSGVDAFCSFLV